MSQTAYFTTCTICVGGVPYKAGQELPDDLPDSRLEPMLRQGQAVAGIRGQGTVTPDPDPPPGSPGVAAVDDGEAGDDDSGSGDEERKPLSKMNKAELQAECTRLGIAFGEETNAQLIAVIEAELKHGDTEDTED